MNGTSAFIVVVVVILLYWLSEISIRWLISWYAERTVNRVLSGIGEGKHLEPVNYKIEIAFDQNGISVRSLKNPAEKIDTIAWSNIQGVTAFKRDLITTDCICLLFALSDETCIELDQGMKGWNEFLEAIPNYLPGCKPLSGWIFVVGSPAFAINPTKIYSRTA